MLRARILAPLLVTLTASWACACGSGERDGWSTSEAGTGATNQIGAMDGTAGTGGAGVAAAGGLDEPSGGSGGAETAAGGEDGAAFASLDTVALYINAGDSLAAGYDAAGNNAPGGKGYARLLLSNHPDYPGSGHLAAVAGSVDFRDVSESGATSDEIRQNLQGAMDGFPAQVPGDVLLTLSAGGNDFNDSVAVMLSAALTQAVAANLRENLAAMVGMVRDRYEDPSAGKEVFVVIQTLHEPTGGTGRIPPEFDDGFCSTLQSPTLQPLAGVMLSNLQMMNAAIAAEAQVQGAFLSDNHQLFLDHGMNAPGAQRWLSGDCTHPTSEGHHQIRRQMWAELTGDWL